MFYHELFGNQTAAKVLLYIANYGEGHTRGISGIFNLSSSQVHKQLTRLESGGILIAKTMGRTKIFTFNPRLGIKKELTELLNRILILQDQDIQKKYFRVRRRPRRTGKEI